MSLKKGKYKSNFLKFFSTKIDDNLVCFSLDFRQVSTEEGESKAKEFEMAFFEVSAKSGVNVPQVFKNLTTQLQGMGDINQSTMNNQTNTGLFLENFIYCSFLYY